MLKFKYDYLNNRLWRIKEIEPDRLYEIDNKFPANFGGEGFILGDNQWITFTLYAQRIKCFTKLIKDNQITYYRKDIPIVPFKNLPIVIPNQYREIMVEFTEEDRVEKINGQWKTKQF